MAQSVRGKIFLQLLCPSFISAVRQVSERVCFLCLFSTFGLLVFCESVGCVLALWIIAEELCALEIALGSLSHSCLTPWQRSQVA